MNLITNGKSAEKIVALWEKADAREKDNPQGGIDEKAAFQGSWELSFDDMEHIINELDEKRRLRNRLESEKNERYREIEDLGKEIDELTEDRDRHLGISESYREEINRVLREIAVTEVSNEVSERAIRLALNNLEDQSIRDLEALNRVNYRERREISMVGSIVSCGTRIIQNEGYSIGVESAATEFGRLVIAWDNDQSSDSCRASDRRSCLSLALCDGAGSGGVSSRILSRILTTILSEMVALSERSLPLLTHRPLVDFLLKRLVIPSEGGKNVHGRSLRDIPEEIAQDALKGLGNAGSTAINAIVHRTGWCWSSGVGDSGLFRIRENQDRSTTVERLINRDDRDDGSTELISHNGYPNWENGKLTKLESGDILIGASDLVMDYFEDPDSEVTLKEIVERARKPSSFGNSEFWQNLLESIDESTEKDDDMTLFVYVHDCKNLEFEEMVVTERKDEYGEDGYFVEDEEFAGQFSKSEKDYYHNPDAGTGLKRITDDLVASNLKICREDFSIDWPDFIPKFDIISGKDRGDYFIVMEHLDEERFYRLDRLIEEAGAEDLVGIISLLNRIESEMVTSGVSHSDFSPTNVFVSKNLEEFRLIDFNTLFVQGCFPVLSELGHTGMYGDGSHPLIHSLYSHVFPIRSLKLSLEMIRSKILGGVANKGIDCFDPSSNEQYCLTPEILARSFWGGEIEEITRELKVSFPEMDEDGFGRHLESLTISEIYNFDSW